jgi:serine/threonine-protein kinase RsbW
MIRLRVPGTLAYRNLALRVVAAACKMIGNDEVAASAAADEFEAQTVSAVGEAFNNIAIHAYDAMNPAEVDISIDSAADRVVIEMTDTGRSFDPAVVAPPDLEQLPESGMGLFIIRSFMDETRYTPGPPANVLRLVKLRRAASAPPRAVECPPPAIDGAEPVSRSGGEEVTVKRRTS